MKPLIISLIWVLSMATLCRSQTGISIDDSSSLSEQAESMRSAAKAIIPGIPANERIWIWKFGTNAEMIYSGSLRTNDDRVAAIGAIDALQFDQDQTDLGRAMAVPFTTPGVKLDRLVLLSDLEHKPASDSTFLKQGWQAFVARIPPASAVYIRPVGATDATRASLTGLPANIHLLDGPVDWRAVLQHVTPPPPPQVAPAVWRRWLLIGVPLALVVIAAIAYGGICVNREKRWDKMEAPPAAVPRVLPKDNEEPNETVITVPRYGLLTHTGNLIEFTACEGLLVGTGWDADVKVEEPDFAMCIRLDGNGVVELVNSGSGEAVIGGGVILRPRRRIRLRPGARAAIRVGDSIFTLVPLQSAPMVNVGAANGSACTNSLQGEGD